MKHTFLFVALVMSGCAQQGVRTNVPEIFQDQVRSSVVKSYTNDEVWNMGAQRVGYVETKHCQASFRDIIPSKSAFIDNLKAKTQKAGGNALVFDSCTVSQSVGCNTVSLCRGTAYLVN